MSEDCRSKGRLKWCESEREARDYCFNHLMTSTYHGEVNGFTEETARTLADECELKVYPDDQKRQKTGGQAASSPSSGGKGDGNVSSGGKGDGKAASTPGGSSQSATQVIAQLRSQLSAAQTQNRLLEARAVAAEQTVDQMNLVITRVVEQVTRADAAIKTAAKFSRQGMDAFETEHHNLSESLERLQTIYSIPVPNPVLNLRVADIGR